MMNVDAGEQGWANHPNSVSNFLFKTRRFISFFLKRNGNQSILHHHSPIIDHSHNLWKWFWIGNGKIAIFLRRSVQVKVNHFNEITARLHFLLEHSKVSSLPFTCSIEVDTRIDSHGSFGKDECKVLTNDISLPKTPPDPKAERRCLHHF